MGKRIIEQTGYHRRDRAVAGLERKTV